MLLLDPYCTPPVSPHPPTWSSFGRVWVSDRPSEIRLVSPARTIIFETATFLVETTRPLGRPPGNLWGPTHSVKL